MIALIIIGSILLLIIILLALSVTIELDYDKEFCYKAKYLFFTISVSPESEKRKKKRARRAAKREKKEQKKQQKSLKKTEKQQKKLQKSGAEPRKAGNPTEEKTENEKQGQAASGEKPKKQKTKLSVDLIQRIYGRTSPHLKRILKHIRIYDVYIDIVVGGEDAAKVAINYGKMNAFVNGGLKILDTMITLQVKDVNIEADFDKEKSDYFAHGKAKLRLSTLLHSGIWGFFAVLKETSSVSAPTASHQPQNINSKTKGK